jgi:DNA-binding LacI/PurR family transcriptional regulator
MFHEDRVPSTAHAIVIVKYNRRMLARPSMIGTGSKKPRGRPATIRDVARVAEVGVGTVSRVVNSHPAVLPATRQRVLAAMAQLGFEPSRIARSLSLRRTLLIAVVVPFIATASVVERLRGVMDAFDGTEYDLVIYNIESVRSRNRVFRRLPHRERADGVIVISLAPTDDEEAAFVAAGTPVVFVDAPALRLPCVVSDDLVGSEMATRHLIERGHRRIGFVGDEFPNRLGFTWGNLRQQGFLRALQAAGLDAAPNQITTGRFGLDEARELALGLLRRPNRPTAIVAGSDTQALGVLAAARECNLGIPGQLSVVGYDDIEVASALGLTTIHQPLFESGREGARLLLDSLEAARGDKDSAPARRVLPVSLVLRHTTASPPSPT